MFAKKWGEFWRSLVHHLRPPCEIWGRWQPWADFLLLNFEKSNPVFSFLHSYEEDLGYVTSLIFLRLFPILVMCSDWIRTSPCLQESLTSQPERLTFLVPVCHWSWASVELLLVPPVCYQGLSVLWSPTVFWSQRNGSMRRGFQGPQPNSSSLEYFHCKQYLIIAVWGSSARTSCRIRLLHQLHCIEQRVKTMCFIGCRMLVLAEVQGTLCHWSSTTLHSRKFRGIGAAAVSGCTVSEMVDFSVTQQGYHNHLLWSPCPRRHWTYIPRPAA